MSQFPWGHPLQQQDPLPMEVDSSTGGWSWQLELAHPQITLPQQQDSLPMSIDPLGGGGGEDEEEWISLLRSCPLRSPPRSLLPFSPASPPDIWVTPWDPYTWTPPCSPQIEQAAAALYGRVVRLLRQMEMAMEAMERQLGRLEMAMERQLGRPKCSVRIQYLNEDDDDDTDNRYDALTVEAPPRNTYGPHDFVEQQFKFCDPYTWIPPCYSQIEQAVALLRMCLSDAVDCLHRHLRRLEIEIKMQMERPLRRPKRSVIIQYNDDDDNIYDVLTVEAHLRKPYGPSDFLKQHFKSTKDGELKYCIHCNDVFPSDTDLFYLNQHLLRSHILVQLRIFIHEVYPPPKSSGGIPDMETALKLTEGSWEGNILLSGNEKPKEIDAQKSASRHVESPLAFDQSNTPPERMLVDHGEAAASIDAVQHRFSEEPAGASNSRGSWEGFQNALEADRGNEKQKEIDSQKSASRHVEFPLAFDQSNTPPERMRVDNGKAAASTDASWIDAVQNCFEETTKADKPKGTLKKKRSAVWEHFVETIIDDTVWADCKHCKKRFAGGTKKAGTSTLRRHLDKLHGIEIPKASSSSKNENLCGVPATSKSKTPTPSLLPSLEPVASKPPGKTTQRKKTTDGVNDLATQEVCARGKRTRRRDNPSSSGVTPSEVPSSASAAPPPTVGHAAEATSTGMVVASSQIALSAAGASGEVVRSIADTIINPGPKDLTNAILLMSQAAEAVAREKMLLQEMEKLRQENTDQATAVHSRLEALEAKLVLAADENKKLKAENTALRSQPQESPHSRPASPPSKRS